MTRKDYYASADRHAQEYGRPPFIAGQRVQAHPGTDTWSGDRFGTVCKVGRTLVHVRMDISGRTIAFHPTNLETC